MKVLLDENLPHALRRRLTGHDVFTVQYMGWRGLKNGRLLSRAAADGFEVLVTTDQGIAHEQNLSILPMAVAILLSRSNDYDDLIVLVPNLLVALNHLKPRSVIYVRETETP